MKRIIGLSVSLALAAPLISYSGAREIVDALKHTRGNYYPVLLTLQFITLLAGACLWYIPILISGVKVSYRQILCVHPASGLVESYTPSFKFGGEAAKIYLLRRISNLPYLKIADTAGLNAYLWVIPFSAIIGLTIIIASLQTDLPQALYGTVILLVTCAGIWLPWYFRRRNIPCTVFHKKRVLGTSLLVRILYPMKTPLAAHASGTSHISIIAAAAATFCAYLIGLLPLLPEGLGSFEGTTVIIIALFGINPAVGTATALTARLITFWFPLLLSALAGTLIHCGNVSDRQTIKESA